MLKELIVCFVIIAIVFSVEMITQKFTDNSLDETSNELEELKTKILESKENEELEENIDNLEKNWEEKQHKLSYYIEHDELEKVDTQLTAIKSDIETTEYNLSIEEINKCIYILKHIKEKQKLTLKNIF